MYKETTHDGVTVFRFSDDRFWELTFDGDIQKWVLKEILELPINPHKYRHSIFFRDFDEAILEARKRNSTNSKVKFKVNGEVVTVEQLVED